MAREFAGAYRRMVDCLRTTYGKDNETALAEAASWPDIMRTEAIEGDPAALTWTDLDRLADEDPALALRRWNEVKEAAIQDLASGHRAARALEAYAGCSHPYDRAEFLALRSALAEEWQPRGGMEWLLVDKLAQATTEEMRWMQQKVFFGESFYTDWQPRGGDGFILQGQSFENAPAPRPVEDSCGEVVATAHLGGLHHRYSRAA